MKFAQAIIEKDGMLDDLIEKQLTGKKYIIDQLVANGYKVNAKEGNFIFIKPRNVDADEIVNKMKNEKKILIKSYSGIGSLGKLKSYNRLKSQYMEQFLEALLDIDR